MAKKSIIQRELKRVRIVKSQGKKRAELREIAKNINVTYEERMDAQQKLQKMPANSSPVRLRRRCRICGRPRGVYRKFGLCRVHLRNFLMHGDVPGGRKASW